MQNLNLNVWVTKTMCKNGQKIPPTDIISSVRHWKPRDRSGEFAVLQLAKFIGTGICIFSMFCFPLSYSGAILAVLTEGLWL